MLRDYNKIPYLLLTPGPLSTSPSVRSAMWYDSCTWDDDYKNIVSDIRRRLLHISDCDPSMYTTVLMQGSGTFGVESVLGSSIHKKNDCVLILVNGVYGKRMVDIVDTLELCHVVCEVDENQSFTYDQVKDVLDKAKEITHIAMVHCETTTGIINALEPIAKLAHAYQKHFIVDAMSSFGGVEIDMTGLSIDFLISSANKCIQGVPGFSFVICKKEKLTTLCKDNAKSLSLDLYGQWREMEKDAGKWRYTSPTHVVLAFHQALLELEEEGGIAARSRRYTMNQHILSNGMRALGFESYISTDLQSPIITTFLEPERIPGTLKKFLFKPFYTYLKNHGFVIYPGKVAHTNSFRIGSIGHLFPKDITNFLSHVKSFIEEPTLSIVS